MKWIKLATAGLAVTQSGCIMAGYSSGGGWLMWPGGLGLLLMIALVLFSSFGVRARTAFRRVPSPSIGKHHLGDLESESL